MTRDLRDNVRFPGNGFPERAEGGQLPGSSGNHPWALLARGKTLGKRVVVPFISANSASTAQTPTVDLLNLQGNDENALQLCVTLGPPKVVAGVSSASIISGAVQNVNGESDNIDLCKTIGDVGGGVGPSPKDISFANPIAIIQWGVGGVSHRAEVDFHNGLAINVVASFLRLSAMIEGAPQTVISVPYVLAGCVGPGYPRPNNAQRTISIGFVGNTVESGVFTVPRFAKSVTLCASDGAGASSAVPAGKICFWRSAGGSADVFPVATFAFGGDEPKAIPVPVPNGAYYFSVVGGFAAGSGGLVTPVYSAIFDLSI